MEENKISTKRKSGLLVHPTSLPSPYGIGDLGESAYAFIDFLIESGQHLWQILPLGPTGFGDSPYQLFSSFAGQPLIISPDLLKNDGLLTEEDLRDIPAFDPHRVDYGPLIEYKTKLFEIAYNTFSAILEDTSLSRLSVDDTLQMQNDYFSFCETNTYWLDDYALFMAAKDAHNGADWTRWEKSIAFPTKSSKKSWTKQLKTSVDYYKFIQFIFYRQWFNVKKYANNNDIEIIGDIPIFVAYDSADVWASKELFDLDKEGRPNAVAGVPPDYFSATGQLWGNPLYKWDYHKKENYAWWKQRVSHMLNLVDIVRIDHFRGFDAYWSVPYGSDTAINGQWIPGPSSDLFEALEAELGEELSIIAEDLGVITKEVEELRDNFNLPGMKILQFAFEDLKDNAFMPHNYTQNCICYSGTHDNDTTLGWYQNAPEESKDKVRRYMNTDANDVTWDFIRTCFGSPAKMAIVPIQDILSLGSDCRMNTPGIGAGNWQYRFTKDDLNEHIAKRLKSITELYGR